MSVDLLTTYPKPVLDQKITDAARAEIGVHNGDPDAHNLAPLRADVAALKAGGTSAGLIAAAGPAVIKASDTFNRADGIAGTAEVGGYWYNSSSGGVKVISNQAGISSGQQTMWLSASSGSLAALNLVKRRGVVSVDVYGTSTAGAALLVRVNAASPGNNYVFIERNQNGNGSLAVGKVVNSVTTYFGQPTNLGYTPAGTMDRITAVLDGATIYAYLNGVLMVTASYPVDPLVNGGVGLRATNAGSALDNFVAYESAVF